MQQRKLGQSGPQVSALGLGTMGMSDLYGAPRDRKTSIATIHAALDQGVTLLDTGDFYGMGHNEMLIAEALQDVARDRVQISVKFGVMRDPAGGWGGIDGRPAAVRNALAYTLRRLKTDHIDIYRLARLDPAVPIEETIGAMADLVREGFIRHIGLSEVSARTLRRAAAVHPISDLQIEYSLISRGIEAEILPTLRELGIGLTAYGVLSRGLLSGSWQKAPLAEGDFRKDIPRFQEGNIDRNLALVETLRGLATARGATVAQMAVAWVAARGPDIVPLVGATDPGQLAESAGGMALHLTPEDLRAIAAAIPEDAVAGARSNAHQMAIMDSET